MKHVANATYILFSSKWSTTVGRRRVKPKSHDMMSVCEKSMHVVANILTLPTLSFAHKTLRTSTTGKAMKNLSRCSEAYKKGPLLLQVHERRSQEPPRQPKSVVKHVVESNNRGSSTTSKVIQIERLEDDVNKKAEVF
ncbi:hypothetical protein JHK82_015677 [Glycine max]|nr:hypothetical protein JHK85_016069 [Glycine max]KAG5046299.1 hypothetical protein JHK86_015705 [Glycine max]KAG5148796.1 hypothetical protein JHK82_015677 [Glycine max]